MCSNIDRLVRGVLEVYFDGVHTPYFSGKKDYEIQFLIQQDPQLKVL